MDAGLDENETELRVLVLAVALEMFADGDGLIRDVNTYSRDRLGGVEGLDRLPS